MSESTLSPVIEALRQRQSNPRVLPDAPPASVIAQVIEAATWAPNHKRTEPWRFVVLSGSARHALAEVLVTSLRHRLPELESSQARAQLEKERNKPLRAPVIIAVAAVPSPDPGIVEEEEIAAVAAAVQNMLLAAEALGLAAIWRTGEPARDPAVKEFLGLPSSAHLLAFVYLGYPAGLVPLRAARPDALSAYCQWQGELQPE